MQPPYKEISIKDLGTDVKIAVTGIVVSKSPNTIVLDDGTGSAVVSIDTNLEVNTFCKVFGTLLPQNDGFAIQGETIQDLSSIDKGLYKKVQSLLH